MEISHDTDDCLQHENHHQEHGKLHSKQTQSTPIASLSSNKLSYLLSDADRAEFVTILCLLTVKYIPVERTGTDFNDTCTKIFSYFLNVAII